MIFALVLTIAYAIYYAVVIAKDLRGKKGQANPAEEVFDLDGMEEEESVFCFHLLTFLWGVNLF